LLTKKARLAALIKATEAYLAECRKSLEINRVNLEAAKTALGEK